MLTPAQREAVNPEISAWVEASAGSGKTRVLVDRLLALMVEGADPERLLCLTFTKAAAAEMDARLKARLSAWSRASDLDLSNELNDLGLLPNERRLTRARRLFQEVLNLLRGVRIQTLHSFCENFLRRFPLEAGVLPAFQVMDEHDARQLFDQNIDAMLNARRGSKDDHTLRAVSAQLSYAQLCGCLWTLSGQRRFAQSVAGIRHLERLQGKLGLQGDNLEAYVQSMLHQTPMDLYAQLLSALEGQADLSASAATKRDRIAAFVDAPTPQTLRALMDVFLTKEGCPRKSIVPKAILQKLECAASLAEEASRFEALKAQETASQVFEISGALMVLFEDVARRYARAKLVSGLVDYEDLIAQSAALLKSGDAWIAYKVDAGIDHILVDEAQDTSRLQWQVIAGLMDVFFESDDTFKTLFVVGDPKQSIYSFQGADPVCFHDMCGVMAQKLHALNRPFKRLKLKTSFRAVPTILSFVDSVFQCPVVQKGVGPSVSHDAHEGHKQMEGSITLWPLLANDEADDADDDVDDGVQTVPPHVRLAFHTAMHIRESLASGLWLPRVGRALAPSDVMVLVRKRGPLVDALARFLRGFGVPVMGQDRLALSETLVVQDLLACARFCLTPTDNLTLAALLKSPLVGLSEDDLFTVCRRPKGRSVWEHLQTLSAFSKVCDVLSEWIQVARSATPLAFFDHIVWTAGGRARLCARLGVDAQDIIAGFLNLVSLSEATLDYSLARLITFMDNRGAPLKRDPEGGDGVRILTIHGAKGLEAPFVVLPETSAFERPAHSLLFASLDDVRVPFLPGANVPPFFKEAVAMQTVQEEEEGARLLYVGLTRASEHLVVGGLLKKRERVSWYQSLAARIAPLGVAPLPAPWGDDGVRHGVCTYSASPKTLDKAVPEKSSFHAVLQPPQPSPALPILTPSSVSNDGEAVSSLPEEGVSSSHYGQAVHVLLTTLPTLARTTWLLERDRVGQWLGLSPLERDQAFIEATRVLDAPTLDFLHQPNVLREVPFSYFDKEALCYVTGRMDCVYERDHDVWGIDFKTGAQDAGRYARQMAFYGSALEKLYAVPRPKSVRMFILWTKQRCLEEICVGKNRAKSV